MPFQADHSGNFPRKFYECPKCGKKGIYKVNVMTHSGEHGTMLRCKYCGKHKVIEGGHFSVKDELQWF